VTQEQQQDQRMLEWLDSGPADVPVEPLEAAIEYARAHPRRRLSWAGLRRYVMDRMHLEEVKPERPGGRRWGPALAAVAAVAVVAVVVVGGLRLLGGSGDLPGAGGVPAASPSPSPVPSTAPAPSPSPPLPAVTSIASSCVVSTLAGKAGATGAVDGVGAEARFSDQMGFILYDGEDHVLYLADGGNHAIRKITRDGVVTTVAGRLGEAGNVDGTGSAARFNTPVGVALWGGQMWIADSGNGTVRRMTLPDGAVTTVAEGFTSPWSIALRTGWGSSIMVYVGELDGGAISQIWAEGSDDAGTLAGTPGALRWAVDGTGSSAGFGWPFGMFDQPEDDSFYVVDVNRDRSASALRLANNHGVVTTLPWDARYGRPGVPWVAGADQHESGDTVFVTTFLDNTVVRMAPDGSLTLLAGSPGIEGSADGTGDVARFTGPLGIVGDGEGKLYVVDAYNSTIRTITCP
jgi:hypothetical protein